MKATLALVRAATSEKETLVYPTEQRQCLFHSTLVGGKALCLQGMRVSWASLSHSLRSWEHIKLCPSYLLNAHPMLGITDINLRFHVASSPANTQNKLESVNRCITKVCLQTTSNYKESILLCCLESLTSYLSYFMASLTKSSNTQTYKLYTEHRDTRQIA